MFTIQSGTPSIVELDLVQKDVFDADMGVRIQSSQRLGEAVVVATVGVDEDDERSLLRAAGERGEFQVATASGSIEWKNSRNHDGVQGGEAPR
jgi:hypothetical protein